MELTTSQTDEQVIKNWLTEYKSLPESSIKDYAQKIHENTDIMLSLNTILTSLSDDALAQLIQPSCHQLFEFYRSRIKELKMFAVGMLPAMVGTYLLVCSSSSHNKLSCKQSLGAYLLSVYNLLCGEKETAHSQQNQLDSETGVEIPNIASPSVYHDPMAHPFSEHTVNMPNPCRTFAQLPVATTQSSISPSNRCMIMNMIMSSFADHITAVSKCSLLQLCNVCLQLASIGFPWHQSLLKVKRSKTDRRTTLDCSLSISLLQSVYYALYNGCRMEATRAVQAMQKRATYDLCPQVLLLCNAMLNSAFHEKGALRMGAPLGLSETLTPAMTRTYSRSSQQIVTAKSIKHYKWQHTSEEISGDFTNSLLQKDSILRDLPPSNLAVEVDDINKSERQFASPSKPSKGKLKKTMPSPSASSNTDKASKGSAASEKLKKWISSGKSAVEEEDSARLRNPSGASAEFQDSTNYNSPAHRFSSTSVPSLKQLNVEEQANLLTDVERNNSVSRTANEAGSSIKRRSAHEPLTTKLSEGNNSPNRVTLQKGRGSDKGKNKDFLQHLLRAGSKKGKDTKLGATQTGVTIENSDFVPLLDPSDGKYASNGSEVTATTRV